MAVELPDQVTAREIAERLGVHYVTVRQWKRGGVLPPAEGAIGDQDWWWWHEIAAWHRDRSERTA